MNVRCGICKFYTPISISEGIGTCHRYAPRPMFDMDAQSAQWPTVPEEEWCGEFVVDISLLDEAEA